MKRMKNRTKRKEKRYAVPRRYLVTYYFLIAHLITPSFSHRRRPIMPTIRSTVSANRSGLLRGSQPSKRKRSNADEHARKRLRDETGSNVGEEEEDQKMKGGRDGKKVKGKKKRNHLR